MTQKKEAFYSVRKIALDLLIEIMEKEAFCDKCLHQALDTYDLEQRDKGFLPDDCSQYTIDKAFQIVHLSFDCQFYCLITGCGIRDLIHIKDLVACHS